MTPEFAAAIKPLFSVLKQSQVDGIDKILAAAAPLPLEFRAYLLATAYLETAQTMQPIKEYGGDAYFRRMYDKAGDRPKVAQALGNTMYGDGVKFPGRGYVQITGRRNYTFMSKRLGVDMVGSPDIALQPDIAAKTMVIGCTEGIFTGRKLSDYLPGDYVNARRVVNGLDRADDIAGYAVVFERALKAAPPVVAPSFPKPVVPTKAIAGGVAGLVVLLLVVFRDKIKWLWRKIWRR